MVVVLPIDVNKLLIQWNDLDVVGDSYRVYRSTVKHEGYELVGVETTKPLYIDSNLNLMENSRTYYYKVEVIKDGQVIHLTQPFHAEYNKADGVARVVIRESNIVLRMMNTPKVKILLRKKTGYHCPECYNTITKRVRFADCPVCNGTGIKHGYHSPVEIRVSRDMSQLHNFPTLLDGEKTELSAVNAWITNYPILTPGDVIVDKMNQRFVVTNITPRYRAQHLIRQIFELFPLEKGHPLYEKDVDLIE